MGMTLFAGAYDAGVDVVGISDLRTFLRNTAPYRRILRISEYGDPDRDADALAKLSPMTYVDRVKGPLLIMQGASDPRVPAGEAVQIHDALESRGVPCKLMIFRDEGHGAQKRENRVLMLGAAVAFFEANLVAMPLARCRPSKRPPPSGFSRRNGPCPRTTSTRGVPSALRPSG